MKLAFFATFQPNKLEINKCTWFSLATPLTNTVNLSGDLSGWKPAIHDNIASLTSSLLSRDDVTSLDVVAVEAIEMMGPPDLLTLGQVIN